MFVFFVNVGLKILDFSFVLYGGDTVKPIGRSVYNMYVKYWGGQFQWLLVGQSIHFMLCQCVLLLLGLLFCVWTIRFGCSWQRRGAYPSGYVWDDGWCMCLLSRYILFRLKINTRDSS